MGKGLDGIISTLVGALYCLVSSAPAWGSQTGNTIDGLWSEGGGSYSHPFIGDSFLIKGNRISFPDRKCNGNTYTVIDILNSTSSNPNGQYKWKSYLLEVNFNKTAKCSERKADLGALIEMEFSTDIDPASCYPKVTFYIDIDNYKMEQASALKGAHMTGSGNFQHGDPKC